MRNEWYCIRIYLYGKTTCRYFYKTPLRRTIFKNSAWTWDDEIFTLTSLFMLLNLLKLFGKKMSRWKTRVCACCNELVITFSREFQIQHCKIYWKANLIIFPTVYSLHDNSCSINTVLVSKLTFLHFLKFWMLIRFMIVCLLDGLFVWINYLLNV